ncbi:hypothetical protein M409DRAFT_66957 [Zasmidium cellare ATCC 36951]|uniref:Uncharacterized protein n=1 Tax=Zasmidium cellare ATCC 36951 TaxID=1080233 RepID=A0A6A6CJD8_ZASCE|nr:uncharacterized protein M409DRAFT_66957 [Zasmidium cellare ATCC 36951]KAF2166072.1 hypothetical protein M409DRAFT_66957 [Zasmidium cellare ATCC 36951]
MFVRSYIIAAAAATLSSTVFAQDVSEPLTEVTEKVSRNDDAPESIFQRDDGVCYAFGIDFQDGGSYFIDSRSNASFTAVSQFEGCQNDTSYILLVNDETGDQYECSSVPTVPEDTAQLSTCPIEKNQMATGNWSILAIGNNGAEGDPFAWQRNFFISVGIPETTTYTPTVTYTQTSTPITTTTSTSVIQTTSTVPNTQTITVPGVVKTKTITPKPVTTTSKKMITRTFNRWTKTQVIITQTTTASCTVPPRPHFPDPECHVIPTIIPIPRGLKINAKRADKPVPIEYARKRFESARAAKARTEQELAARDNNLAVRSPDAPTITITAQTAVNSTTTIYASTSTITDVTLTTSTALITNPPSTIKQGVLTKTITIPPKTKTITRIGYTVSYKTKTMSLTWTRTTTVTPTAQVTACKRKGGHFGKADL